MSSSPPRLLFYSHNGVGLGHFRRQLRLACAFGKRHPDAVIVLATGSHATAAFDRPPGVEILQLPPIRKIGRYEAWEPRDPAATIDSVMRERSRLLLDAVDQLRPNLLIADFMPAGPHGELLGALDRLRAYGGRAIAGFRDIVDEPEFVRGLWRESGVYEVLHERYDAICVYGTRDVVDFEADYGLDGVLAERLQYVGYLGRAHSASPSETGGAPLMVASSGGGIDGGALLHSFVDAAKMLGPRLGGSRLVVGGPLLAQREMDELLALANGSGIEVRRFASELDEWIARSDLVVTMPGYNTICELFSGDARAIVVPRSGPSLEQRIRAATLERWQRAISLDPLNLDADRLAATIETVLSDPKPQPVPVPLDGLEHAVDLFEALATGERPPVAVR